MAKRKKINAVVPKKKPVARKAPPVAKPPEPKPKQTRVRASGGFTSAQRKLLENPDGMKAQKLLFEIEEKKLRLAELNRTLLPADQVEAKSTAVFAAGKIHVENMPGAFRLYFGEAATAEMLRWMTTSLLQMLADMEKAAKEN